MSHIVSQSKDKHGNYHSNCTCGWHGQAKSQASASAFGAGHLQRHANDHKVGRRPASDKANKSLGTGINIPEKQKEITGELTPVPPVTATLAATSPVTKPPVETKVVYTKKS